jgi:hypothetical protein
VLKVFPQTILGCPHLIMCLYTQQFAITFICNPVESSTVLNVSLTICADPEASVWSEYYLISPFGDCTAASV